MRNMLVPLFVGALFAPATASGQVPGRLVGWVAEGGSISPSGVYTAGSVPGTYQITATSEGLSGTATVVILDRPSRPFPWKQLAFACGILRCDRVVRTAISDIRWRNRRLIGFRILQPPFVGLVLLMALTAFSRIPIDEDGFSRSAV